MKNNPILDAVDVSDFGAWQLDIIIDKARQHPVAQAYDDNNGRWVYLATKKPTKRDINAFNDAMGV